MENNLKRKGFGRGKYFLTTIILTIIMDLIPAIFSSLADIVFWKNFGSENFPWVLYEKIMGLSGHFNSLFFAIMIIAFVYIRYQRILHQGKISWKNLIIPFYEIFVDVQETGKEVTCKTFTVLMILQMILNMVLLTIIGL